MEGGGETVAFARATRRLSPVERKQGKGFPGKRGGQKGRKMVTDLGEKPGRV